MSDSNKKNGKTAAATAEPMGLAGAAPVSAEVMPRAALTVFKEGSVGVPTEEEIEARGLAVGEKLESLGELMHDPGLSEEMKAKVKGLLALAAPVKPGMEEMNTTWSVVRVNVAQPTTQAAAKPEAARPGDLYTTAGALLEKPFAFIPLHFNLENVMFIEGRRAPMCGAPDAKLGVPNGLCKNCQYLPYGQQNGGSGEQVMTDCQNQIVVAALAADLSQVCLLTFAKSSRRAGSDLVKLAKAHPYPWKQSYLLSTEKKSGDLGVYYICKIEPTSRDNPPEVVRLAQALSELYSANRKKFLAEWYLRASSANQMAGSSSSRLRAGGDGNEPGEPSPSPVRAVRTTAFPM